VVGVVQGRPCRSHECNATPPGRSEIVRQALRAWNSRKAARGGDSRRASSAELTRRRGIKTNTRKMFVREAILRTMKTPSRAETRTELGVDISLCRRHVKKMPTSLKRQVQVIDVS
jgi:Arc/MetJ-type ribon-helix-helix transcriptional regulator